MVCVAVEDAVLVMLDVRLQFLPLLLMPMNVVDCMALERKIFGWQLRLLMMIISNPMVLEEMPLSIMLLTLLVSSRTQKRINTGQDDTAAAQPPHK
jgi:hypothetical protein